MTIYLLPNLFDETQPWEPFLPESVKEAVASLDGLIAESEKAGRRYLRRFVDHDRMAATPIRLLNEHTQASDIAELLAPIAKGERWGLVSDAGLPCIADPGAPLVLMAHERKIQLTAFPGPCSMMMALQLSGLCGQRFAFHGYLPRDVPELKRSLQQIEARSKQENAAQLWIEAPYRSAKMASNAIESLSPSTLFCIALDLTFPTQSVRTQTILRWRKEKIEIGKQPAVFLIQAR